MSTKPKVSLNYGLDHDGTMTAEPEGFRAFIEVMRALGHKVYIVTFRYPSEATDIVETWGHLVDGVICTGTRGVGRVAKDKAMLDLGIKINIWIEDTPRAVHESAKDIWGWEMPEGHVHAPTHEEGVPVVPQKPLSLKSDVPTESVNQFIERIRGTTMTREEFDNKFVVLPCEDGSSCERGDCSGWIKIPRTAERLLDHFQIKTTA